MKDLLKIIPDCNDARYPAAPKLRARRWRLCVLLLFLAMAGWCAHCPELWAADTTTITIGRASAPAGAIAILPVSHVAPAERPTATLVLRFAYNATNLEVLEVIGASVLAEYGKNYDVALREGALAIALYGGDGPIPDGTLLHLLVFVKPAAATNDVLPVLNTSSHGSDKAEQQTAVQVSAGNIRVLAPLVQHSADTTGDWSITLSELLRVIQLYNAGEYHCDPLGEDGYAPGTGNQDCAYHSADYAPADWRISFSELLRMIQLYNAPHRMYHADPDNEDGFAPGPFGYTP